MTDLDDFRKDILEHIFITGGYTNTYNLMKYLGLGQKTCWHYLEIFSTGNIKERYLKKVNEDTRGSKDKLIYQVTGKTCTLFSQKDSYYRKKHSREYIARSLLKNRYFSIHKDLKSNTIFLHDDKLEYLKSLGFSNENLPFKYVGNNKIYGIEDTLFIKNNNLKIIYFDKESVTVKRQVTSLYYTYAQMIKSNIIPISISVITTNHFREKEFIKQMPKYNSDLFKTDNLENSLVELYASFNARIAERNGEDREIIRKNLEDGSIKKALVDKFKESNKDINDEDIEVIRLISKGGIKSIIDRLKVMLDNEDEQVIREYLLRILRLNYHDYIIFKNRESVSNVDVISANLF